MRLRYIHTIAISILAPRRQPPDFHLDHVEQQEASFDNPSLLQLHLSAFRLYLYTIYLSSLYIFLCSLGATVVRQALSYWSLPIPPLRRPRQKDAAKLPGTFHGDCDA